MIKVKIKRQTKDKSIGQAFTIALPCSTLHKEVPLLFLIWQLFFFQAPDFTPNLVKVPMSDSFNFSLGGAKHLHSTLQPSGQ